MYVIEVKRWMNPFARASGRLGAVSPPSACLLILSEKMADLLHATPHMSTYC